MEGGVLRVRDSKILVLGFKVGFDKVFLFVLSF